MLSMSERATAATTVLVRYRIQVGALGGSGRAQAFADRITAAWRTSDSAFVVRDASTPAEGGASGEGVVLGILSGIWPGFTDYFSTIEIKTDYGLRTMTWAQLFGSYRELGLTDLYATATLESADILSRPQATAAAQQANAESAATQSRETDIPSLALDVVGGLWLPLLLLAACIGLVLYLRKRGAS